jgi:hypothetical protein
MGDCIDPTKGFEGTKRDVLFEVFVMNGRARFSSHNVNECSDLGRIDCILCVTVSRRERLYQT